MPTKIIILTNCSHCPYKHWDKAGQKRWCTLSNKLIDVAVTTIPEWCELENYAETKEKADKERERAEI